MNIATVGICDDIIYLINENVTIIRNCPKVDGYPTNENHKKKTTTTTTTTKREITKIHKLKIL